MADGGGAKRMPIIQNFLNVVERSRVIPATQLDALF
jgi:hypothetical protein